MLVLYSLVGMAVGSILTTMFLSAEYRRCKDLLKSTEQELRTYQHSNKELLNIISHLREVNNNE